MINYVELLLSMKVVYDSKLVLSTFSVLLIMLQLWSPSASLVAPSMSEACPLCSSPLIQQVLQPTKALKTCTNESCVFPFNLNTAELSAQGILYTVNDDAIVAPMLPQIEAAGVDPRLAYFIVRPDDDIHQHPQL